MKKIKDTLNYYKAAIPQVAKAVSKKLIGDVADTEVRQFRKFQCESCLLFDGDTCNKNRLASHEGNSVALSIAENKQAGYILTKDGYDNIRTAVRNGEVFYRGCGCPQTGSHAKWKFSFSEEDLNKKDGTSPCPMGKWSTDNFKKWKNEFTK